MRFINVAHKYINNIDVENTMKVVKYICSIENVFPQTIDDRLVQNICRHLNL